MGGLPGQNATWTHGQIESLKSLYASGMSSSRIAAEMGCGLSRNSIIGKVHRLGLTRIEGYENRPKMQPRKRHQPYKPRPKKLPALSSSYPAFYAPVELRCVEVYPRLISLRDLQSNDCRFPYGEGPYLFCGHPKFEGHSYCGPHAALATERRGHFNNMTEAGRAVHRKRMRLTIFSLNREYAGEDVA